MPYTATLAARLSQFGTTVIDFNLVDQAGVMPMRRVSHKWRSDTVTNAQRNAAAAALAQQAEDEWQAEQLRDSRRRAFLERFTTRMDQLAAEVNAELQQDIANSNLTPAQKAVGSQAVFNWRFE
jgi:hypothetical protein